MALPDVPESLRPLVERLPFPLDDAEQAGETFERWQNAPASETRALKRTVDLWTYCFVRRYFWVKFIVSDWPSSDLDELVSRTYRKVDEKRDSVREPLKYAHWVSVVCKNTFINYVNRERAPKLSLDSEGAPPVPSGEEVRGDIGLGRKIVSEAIGRLPDYLRPVATMHLLEERTYHEMSEALGLSVPTLRAYTARARKHLRNDDSVRSLLE